MSSGPSGPMFASAITNPRSRCGIECGTVRKHAGIISILWVSVTVSDYSLYNLNVQFHSNHCSLSRFNYRSTHHMVQEGFYNFLNWFDERAWYPLGRIVGGTVSIYLALPGISISANQIDFLSVWAATNSKMKNAGCQPKTFLTFLLMVKSF